MREILFRGKRTDNGEWVEGCVLYDSEQNEAFIAECFEDKAAYIRAIIPETVGQYTGLTDRNGKKIFEGDILKCSDGKFCVVEWDEPNARFLGFTIGVERFIAYVGREPKSEIIGNIHDNPDLLKENGDD